MAAAIAATGKSRFIRANFENSKWDDPLFVNVKLDKHKQNDLFIGPPVHSYTQGILFL